MEALDAASDIVRQDNPEFGRLPRIQWGREVHPAHVPDDYFAGTVKTLESESQRQRACRRQAVRPGIPRFEPRLAWGGIDAPWKFIDGQGDIELITWNRVVNLIADTKKNLRDVLIIDPDREWTALCFHCWRPELVFNCGPCMRVRSVIHAQHDRLPWTIVTGQN